ncbi:monomeric sarcosine oxidase-like [Saccoglossus kowalevskii]|uniref:Uncharacterized protein LOC100373335 n=1 Tax=Saccoglossus kowalevskii TaxID=10224 RepID=A0ABM0MUT2_SACKO|nr:PREDICTED: uncharacterized protein LOC100373335 [Saccoglossus kowalevskii]
MDGVVYDLCIVGAGLIGSAAARHATIISPAAKICLIGPKEPVNLAENPERTICSSHYDEGRLVKTMRSDSVWAVLDNRSISRYEGIQQQTGTRFFTDVGFMMISLKEGHKYTSVMKDIAVRFGKKFDILDKTELTERYDYLSMRPNDEAILELKHAGYVSGRKQVLAQQTAARQQGCVIIDDIINHVIECNQSTVSNVMKLTTDKGHTIRARKVLLTTGAFTSFRHLLPPGKELDVTLYSKTQAFAELTPEDAKRLTDMPTIARKYTKEGKHDLYMLPPIKYPNGKYYLKIGHGAKFNTVLNTEKEVADWFRTEGHASAHKPLLDMMFDIVKGVKPVSTHGGSCVITTTPTGHVYCDMVTPTLGVAVGGNGGGASAADEIGNMAARMMIAGKWDHDLSPDSFRVKFKNKASSLQ